MCNTLQRYKFESNSQRLFRFHILNLGCAIPCKDTNLKAIHNQFAKVKAETLDVQYPAKIQIWKQFTTKTHQRDSLAKMCNTLQRYKFESNSQPNLNPCAARLWCAIPCKDTNLKAIHNYSRVTMPCAEDVQYPAKIQIWKQFTT